MYLYEDNGVVKEYDVNIKRELEDRKIWEDDQTPEGIFTIETMDTISIPNWSRWMRLDTTEVAIRNYREAYPDGAYRIEEFEQKYGPLNTDEQFRLFNEKNSRQKILRGIGIHGGGFNLYKEWTQGCVAMDDEDVIELFDLLRESDNGGIGTRVVIQD